MDKKPKFKKHVILMFLFIVLTFINAGIGIINAINSEEIEFIINLAAVVFGYHSIIYHAETAASLYLEIT